MDITLLIELFAVLVTILGVLIFFLLYLANRKRKLRLKKEGRRGKEERVKTDFESLVGIIRDENSTTQELKQALSMIIDFYGTIDKFDIYGEILIRICRHPNTTKNIILDFNKGLEDKNQKYIKLINDFIAKGLHSR